MRAFTWSDENSTLQWLTVWTHQVRRRNSFVKTYQTSRTLLKLAPGDRMSQEVTKSQWWQPERRRVVNWQTGERESTLINPAQSVTSYCEIGVEGAANEPEPIQPIRRFFRLDNISWRAEKTVGCLQRNLSLEPGVRESLQLPNGRGTEKKTCFRARHIW